MKKILFIIAFFTSVILKAQIPNNGFELWTTINGYYSPNSWSNLNATTKSFSVFTCSKLSSGNSGNSYLAVISQSIAGKGVVPGRVVLGKIDTLTFKPISGFAYSFRPSSLSYNMQYMVSLPTDTAYVSVTLTKWNSTLMKRDTIAFGVNRFNAMAHTWFTNNTTLNYRSGDVPDSACIVISASSNNPLHNSFMYIDNLQFNGNIISVNGQEAIDSKLNLFPTPARDKIFYNVKSADVTERFDIWITDIKGSLYRKIENMKAEGFINVSDWQEGAYFIELNNKQKVYRNKIVIN